MDRPSLGVDEGPGCGTAAKDELAMAGVTCTAVTREERRNALDDVLAELRKVKYSQCPINERGICRRRASICSVWMYNQCCEVFNIQVFEIRI